jgi:hypothetical protein
MLIFQPPVNFCSDENIQTIFGIKLEDLLNYRINYNSISQTVEKVVNKIPGDQKGLFKLAIQLRAFCYSAVCNTATGYVF